MNPRVPGHIDRGCVGPGRRRDTGRGLWGAGRWSLRPAGGAVCSHWGSGTWAAPLNSSTPSPAAPPSSDCQTTCQTGKDMKEYSRKAVSTAWFLTASWICVGFSSRWDHCKGALGASSFICSHIPTLLEGFVSLQTPTMRQQWQRLTTIVSKVFSFKVFSCLIFRGTWYLWKTNTVKQKTRKWANVVQASTLKQSQPGVVLTVRAVTACCWSTNNQKLSSQNTFNDSAFVYIMKQDQDQWSDQCNQYTDANKWMNAFH